MPDDYSANTQTTGTVAVGGSATGVIEKRGDVDWFAVQLVAGRTYVIDLEGAGAGSGTLGDAMLYGLFDDAGSRVARRDRDSGEGNDARIVFTATESGTFYIAARGQRKDDTGTYTVRVRDQDAGVQTPQTPSVNTNAPETPEPTSGQPQTPQPPVDPDATAGGASDLGDLAGGRLFRRDDMVDGGDDATDYWRFSLSERQTVTLSLRRQDANADLYLEDGDGAVLASSTMGGTRNEGIERTLEAGTYFVRVAAQEAGDNDYTLRAKATAPEVVIDRPQGQNAGQQGSVLTTVSEPDGGDLPANASTTGRVVVGGTATGKIQGFGDHDWFKVDLKARKTYRIEMRSQDTDFGTYEQEWELDIDGDSWPHAPRFDAPTYLVPEDGVGLIPYYGGWILKSVGDFTPWLDGTYHVVVSGRSKSKTGTYTLSVTEISDDFADGTSTTGTVAVGGSVRGEISYVGDGDWFKVELEAGTTYEITRSGRAEIYYPGTNPTEKGTLRNSLVRGAVHDDEGELIGGTEYHGRPVFRPDNTIVYPNEGTESKRFTPDEEGTYYVSVYSASDAHYELGTYTLSVSEVDAM